MSVCICQESYLAQKVLHLQMGGVWKNTEITLINFPSHLMLATVEDRLDEHLVQDSKADPIFYRVTLPQKNLLVQNDTCRCCFHQNTRFKKVLLHSWPSLDNTRVKTRKRAFIVWSSKLVLWKYTFKKNLPTQNIFRILKMPEEQRDFWLHVTLEKTSPEENRSGHSEALSGQCLALNRTWREACSYIFPLIPHILMLIQSLEVFSCENGVYV